MAGRLRCTPADLGFRGGWVGSVTTSGARSSRLLVTGHSRLLGQTALATIHREREGWNGVANWGISCGNHFGRSNDSCWGR